MTDLSQLSNEQLMQLYQQSLSHSAIRQVESGGAPDTAKGIVSPKGATGAMQVMPGTAKSPGFGVRPSSGTPEDTAREGRDYYDALEKKYGDPVRAAVAYNWGPGNADSWIAKGARLSDLPDETLKYVVKFNKNRRGHIKLKPAETGAGAPAAPKEEESSHFLGRVGKDVAGIADMILSTPGAMASSLAGKAYETFSPLPVTQAQLDAQTRTGEQIRDTVSAWTTSPISRIMHAMGYGKDYSDADIGKVSQTLQDWMGKGSDWISQHSGGAVSAQQVQVLANDVMNLAPLGFSRFARAQRGKLSTGEVTSGKLKASTADDILKAYEAETGNPEGLSAADVQRRMEKTLSEKSDMEINAESTAYELMTRGADDKAVAAARKRNPMVAKKLDEFMAKRHDLMKGPFSEERVASSMQENAPQKASVAQVVPAVAPSAPAALPEAAKAFPASGTRSLKQGGAVDLRTLIPVAGIAAGAYAGTAAADREKLEGAILGGFGGLAATVLPRYATRIGDRWGQALKLTATTAGVTAGAMYLDKDHPIEGAVIGTLWGASHMLPKARIPKVGNMTIDEMVNARNGAIASQERQISNTSWAMRTAVPDAGRRAAVAEALEKGSTQGLSAQETRVYNAYRGFTKSYGQAAQDVGVLKDLTQNYVTHVVEREHLPQSNVQAVMAALFGDGEHATGGAPTSSRFAKQRKYATFAELEAAIKGTGLVVKTKDVADLVDIYGHSMAKAIENRNLFNNLKAARDGEGKAYIVEAGKAPMVYENVETPQLRGQRVHPDIAPALRFAVEQYRPGYVTRGILGLSMAQKRLSTGLSLFHAQNLVWAYIGAGGNPLTLKGKVDAALQLYRQGGLGDVVDLGLRNGLKVERPMETDLHAGKHLGEAIDALVNQTLGTRLSAFEKGFGGLEKVQREVFDRLTWDYLHSGLKLALFTREFEKGLRAKSEWSEEQVARQVASFVNDTFGGLDWFRVATETQSQIARKIALNVFSPKGRNVLQLLMFAPDWTMSTFRAMYKALPGSSAMPLTQGLHQKYVMRTAILWVTLLNGINMATSGHPIWDNKDPTRIEYRDGTTQQIAKHAMEGPEWLLNPRQTALNKLGVPVKEILDQLLGVEYLTTGKPVAMQESRLGHLAKAVAPISVTSASGADRDIGEKGKRALLSSVGLPVYGMTTAEKAAAKEARRRAPRKRRGQQ